MTSPEKFFECGLCHLDRVAGAVLLGLKNHFGGVVKIAGGGGDRISAVTGNDDGAFGGAKPGAGFHGVDQKRGAPAI